MRKAPIRIVRVELVFEADPGLVQGIVQQAKDEGCRFNGDDDFRDAVHGLVSNATDRLQAEDDCSLFGGALQSITTTRTDLVNRK